jgi:hypothetical protein
VPRLVAWILRQDEHESQNSRRIQKPESLAKTSAGTKKGAVLGKVGLDTIIATMQHVVGRGQGAPYSVGSAYLLLPVSSGNASLSGSPAEP